MLDTVYHNNLVPLPGLKLPADFHESVGFMPLVTQALTALRIKGQFLPPRFFAYYFQGVIPVGVGGSWTVNLDISPPIRTLRQQVKSLTLEYSFVSSGIGVNPDYLLVHDRWSGECWLRSFNHGLSFIVAVEPMVPSLLIRTCGQP